MDGKLENAKKKQKEDDETLKNYLKSIEYLKSLLNSEDFLNKKELIYDDLGIKLGGLGDLYLKRKEEDKTIENYNYSINYSKKALEYNTSESTYNNLGTTYGKLGKIFKQKEKDKAIENYNYAINYFKEALKLTSDRLSTNNNLGTVYGSLGNLYLTKGDDKEAINNYSNSIIYLKKSLKKALEGNSSYNKYDYWFKYNNLGAVFGNLGNLYLKKEDDKEAIKNYKEAEAYLKKAFKLNSNDIMTCSNLGAIYGILGNMYLEKEIKKDAIGNYIESINKYEKIFSLKEISEDPLFNLSSSEEGKKKLMYLKESLKQPLFNLGNLLIKYLKIAGKEGELYNEVIEKFIEYKCYVIVNNLQKIGDLDKYSRNKIVKNIKLKIKKDFKMKIKVLKNKNKKYEDIYYMYKTIDKKLINDLNEKRMWKGRPEDFNDPFDPYYKRFSTIIKEELKKIRISCFTEDYDNLLMWSHYGDNHKGICFGYKFEDIHMDDSTFFEKIIYKELKTNIEIDEMLKMSVKIKNEVLTISEVYLRKHKNWEYENEWRLINLNYKEDYYYNIKISEVYFGIDSALEDIKVITKLLKDRTKIIFYKMTQGNNLTLDRREIELNKKREIILGKNGKIKLKQKNKGNKQLKTKDK